MTKMTFLVAVVMLAGCGGGVGRFPGTYSAGATLTLTANGKSASANATGDVVITSGAQEDEIFTTGDLCDTMPAIVSGSTATYKPGWGCASGNYRYTLKEGSITLDAPPLQPESIRGESRGTFAYADSAGSHYSGTFSIEWRGTRK